MSEDEGETIRLLKERRQTILPVIESFGGIVVDLAGDGILATFPSAVRAVECSLTIQEKVDEGNRNLPEERWMRFRLGINLGDVVREEARVYGDGVNIAARLEALADPGGVVISGAAYDQVNDKLKCAFESLGEHRLKNIMRPIRVYRVIRPGREDSNLVITASRSAPSIAVLPFANISADPEQDYFADGIVEDITTALSRIRWLFVIARNSSFVYKGKMIDVRQVGRELGVRYVLEGGVRKAGQRLRITAQLVDTMSAAQVWAERFDGTLEDVFDLQDQIAERVVAAVEPNVQKSEIERSRRKRPDSLDAYDLYLRALPYTASQSADEGKVAIEFLKKALAIEPDYAAAHALIAWCYEWCYSRAGFAEANKAAALHHARAAISGGTDDANALAIAGFVIVMLAKDPAGLKAIDRGLAINPSCATALFVGSAANAFMERPSQALSFADAALRHSPFDLLVSVAHTAKAVALLLEGRYADAASNLDRSVEANPSLSSFRFFAACAHALAGDFKQARCLADEGLAMEPGFKLRFFFELLPLNAAEKFASGGRVLGLLD